MKPTPRTPDPAPVRPVRPLEEVRGILARYPRRADASTRRFTKRRSATPPAASAR